MRWLAMVAALFVLGACAIGVLTLFALGFDLRETLGILVPMAVGVAAFSAAVTYFGRWTVRRLNQEAEGSGGKEKAKEGESRRSGRRDGDAGDV